MTSEWVQAPEPYERYRIVKGHTVSEPGSYWWCGLNDDRSYVGQSQTLRKRLIQHNHAGANLTEGRIFHTDTPEAAERLETALIYLLKPTVNIVRPAPPRALWAATLGMTRGRNIGWAWYHACGHVQIGRHVGADELLPECHHKLWDWFSYAQNHVTTLEQTAAYAVAHGEASSEQARKITEDLDYFVAGRNAWVDCYKTTKELLDDAIIERERLSDLLASLELAP